MSGQTQCATQWVREACIMLLWLLFSFFFVSFCSGGLRLALGSLFPCQSRRKKKILVCVCAFLPVLLKK